jgi:hypothetical protein
VKTQGAFEFDELFGAAGGKSEKISNARWLAGAFLIENPTGREVAQNAQK